MILSNLIKKIFGTKNDRVVKQHANRVKKINELEPTYEKLSDEALKEAFEALKVEVKEGKSLDDV